MSLSKNNRSLAGVLNFSGKILKGYFQLVTIFKCFLLGTTAFFSPLLSGAQNVIDSTAQSQDSIGQPLAVMPLSPSGWLQQSQNKLMFIEGKLMSELDTLERGQRDKQIETDFNLIKNEFTSYNPLMRLRTLDDIMSQLAQLQKQVNAWRAKLNRTNSELANEIYQVKQIRHDSMQLNIRKDSALWNIYKGEFTDLNKRLQLIDSLAQVRLQHYVDIERLLNRWSYNIAELRRNIEKAIEKIRSDFFHKTHPAIWELNAASYPKSFGQIFTETIRQNITSLVYYGKNAYMRAIFFRVLLLIITLVPIWYFKKFKKRFQPAEDQNRQYKFVHKYTGASTSSFVLVIAPFIFINSPHIFTEVIFVALCITTSVIFIKENPQINRKLIIALLIIYIILRVMNLMTSVSVLGRTIFSLSIASILPLIGVYRSIPKTTLGTKWVFRLITILTGLLFISGWGLSILGYYPIGRILLLSSFDQFFLAIILYVAIYSLIDFISILADLYNSSNRITIIRVDLIYDKLLNLFRFMALVFWIWALFMNVNANEFLKSQVFKIFEQDFTIGGYSFSPGSIIIIFASLYLSIYLSGMLDGLFYDEKRSAESTNKTSLGSAVLLLRLFIISLGFILGMIIAGIPLTNISLFVSALGIGIGFGLQKLISNVMSGLIIAFEKPVYVGDIIEIDGSRGRVTDIGLRSTKVDTFNGAEFIIPNGDLVEKALKNWTFSNRNCRVEFNIYTALDNDSEKVMGIIEDAILVSPQLYTPSPPPKVRLQEMTHTALRFEITCWVGHISGSGDLKNELLTHIHSKLLQAGIKFH